MPPSFDCVAPARFAPVEAPVSAAPWKEVFVSFVNDDGHQMAAQIPVFIAQGLNDDQLDDALSTCLETIEDCVSPYVRSVRTASGARAV